MRNLWLQWVTLEVLIVSVPSHPWLFPCVVSELTLPPSQQSKHTNQPQYFLSWKWNPRSPGCSLRCRKGIGGKSRNCSPIWERSVTFADSFWCIQIWNVLIKKFWNSSQHLDCPV
jgi:hypothetical protein